jgi:hypothetical protein
VSLTKKTFNMEILEEITETLMEKIVDMVNQSVQDALDISRHQK